MNGIGRFGSAQVSWSRTKRYRHMRELSISNQICFFVCFFFVFLMLEGVLRTQNQKYQNLFIYWLKKSVFSYFFKKRKMPSRLLYVWSHTPFFVFLLLLCGAHQNHILSLPPYSFCFVLLFFDTFCWCGVCFTTHQSVVPPPAQPCC